MGYVLTNHKTGQTKQISAFRFYATAMFVLAMAVSTFLVFYILPIVLMIAGVFGGNLILFIAGLALFIFACLRTKITVRR